jgi:hypothetical protein
MYEILSDTRIKASRKSHVCCCGKVLPPGSSLTKMAYVTEGEFHSIYACGDRSCQGCDYPEEDVEQGELPF